MSFQVYRRLIPQYAKSLKLFEGTFSPFKGMQVVRAPGHTDNHYVYKFSSMGKTLFVVGDAWVSQVRYFYSSET